MKTLIRFMLVTLAFLALAAPVSANQTLQFGEDSAIKMIRPIGGDGDGMYYVVYCKNGHQGSIEVYESRNEICIGAPRECRPSWSLLPAAETLCR